MARQESEVPLEQRFVLIKGIVSMSICEKVYTNFTLRIDEKKVCCFMSFAYADLPKGKRFDLVFSKLKPEKHIDTSIEVAAITQKFGEEWEFIPHGWKTICILDFPDGIPELISTLPIVEEIGILLTRKNRYAFVTKRRSRQSKRAFPTAMNRGQDLQDKNGLRD